MKLIKIVGATSEIWQIFIADSSVTTGAGLTGLVFNSASLTAYYHRDTDTTATAITLVTMTVGTFTSGGFKEIDATHMPGWYQFCPPNLALASGAKSCAIHLKGATNMTPVPIEVQLTVGINLDTGGVLSVTTANDLADALLKRDWTAVSGEAARSVLNALRFLRNKWTISGGTLTVRKEDDSSSAWTGAVTTAVSNPVTEIDPA